MEAKRFLVTLFQDEDGVYIAECPAIPGCVSQGETAQGAEERANWLHDLAKRVGNGQFFAAFTFFRVIGNKP